MKDQYAGNIGDFAKLGLLRYLNISRLGVIWYKNISVEFGSDGKFTEYLYRQNEFGKYDQQLFDYFKNMVFKDQDRKIYRLEKIIRKSATATFFEEQVLNGIRRAEWFGKACKEIDNQNCELVFVDPDNGIDCESLYDSVGEKHVCLQEISELSRYSSLLAYHHLPREKHADHIEKVLNILNSKTNRPVHAIRAGRFSPRAFFLISSNKKLQENFKYFSEKWKRFLITNPNIPYFYQTRQ